MIDGKNIFDQPVKNDLRYITFWKIVTGQGDDYTTGFFARLSFFQKVL